MVEIFLPADSSIANIKDGLNSFKGKVIGKWIYEDRSATSGLALIKENGILVLYSVYADGSSSKKAMIEFEDNRGKRLDYADGSYNGEYYIFSNKNQSLEMYNSEDNRFGLARPI